MAKYSIHSPQNPVAKPTSNATPTIASDDKGKVPTIPGQTKSSNAPVTKQHEKHYGSGMSGYKGSSGQSGRK